MKLKFKILSVSSKSDILAVLILRNSVYNTVLKGKDKILLIITRKPLSCYFHMIIQLDLELGNTSGMEN